MPPLNIGAVLKDRYRITDLLGWVEGAAAYVVIDRSSREQWLLWESAALFKMSSKPPGVREYFQQEGKHYLLLQLQNQTLDFLLSIAGRLEEKTAGMWLLQICQAIGYWHNRQGREPLICLRQGSLALADFRLTSAETVMVPSYGNFSAARSAESADDWRFSAPEREREAITPRSDVYALGAMLYCLLTGQPAPEPQARLERKSKLIPPRRIYPKLSRGMEEIVLKAMQLAPARRYATATEMASDLESLLAAKLDKEPQAERKPSLWARLVPVMLTILLLACLIVAIDRLQRPNIRISLPWFESPPTPTFTPAPEVTPQDTPTSAPTITPTPIPAVQIVANQIRTDQFPQVIAYVGVLDENQEPIAGLDPGLFRLKQDGVDIVDFQLESATAARDPLAMVVAIDISGSMKGEPLTKAKAAAANFVGRFDTSDQVSLIKFDDQIQVVQDFTTDKQAVIEAINSLRTRGDTALYDVIAQSVQRLGARQGRRAVVVLTDGRDTASVKYKLKGAIAAANEANIPIFVVGLNSSQFTPEIMEQISAETGGAYLFAPTPDDLDALYQKIRGQLQNQYRIEFTSLHGPDGANHMVAIGLSVAGDLVIWGEKEYRAP